MKRLVYQNSKLMEILRFVIVGVISTAVTYGAYYFLMDFTNSSIAFTIAYLIAFVVNFILTTTFTFAVKATAKRGIGFMISNAVNYLLSIGLLNLFIYLGISRAIAPIPMFAITIPTNFFIVRWVMKGKRF